MLQYNLSSSQDNKLGPHAAQQTSSENFLNAQLGMSAQNTALHFQRAGLEQARPFQDTGGVLTVIDSISNGSVKENCAEILCMGELSEDCLCGTAGVLRKGQAVEQHGGEKQH